MARGHAASASVHADSIKGLAQSVADPTYRRLLTAEPMLRRAVPVLIIAFLLTVGIGAVIQILEHRRQALSDGLVEIDRLADIVAERLARMDGSDAAHDPQSALQRTLPASAATRVAILVADVSETVVASWPARTSRPTVTLMQALGTVTARRADEILQITRHDGSNAFAALRDLPHPLGRIAVVQSEAAMLAAWRTDAALTVTLFATT